MGRVTKRTLLQTHDDYRPDLWGKYRALYEGGATLMESPHLTELFPQHVGEHTKTYAARIGRAVYINYAAYIVNQHVVSLADDPVTVTQQPETRSADFYQAWLEDASAPGANRTPWPDMLQAQLISALTCRQAWTHVQLPDSGAGDFESRAEQDRAGSLHAFATPFSGDMITQWHATDDGRLRWILVHSVDDGRDEFASDKPTMLTWEHWTDDIITTWTIDEEKFKRLGDDEEVPGGQTRPNPYGRVPFVRLAVPTALWMMDQLFSVARELFNKRSALSWAEYRALFPQLVGFLKHEKVQVDGGLEGGSADRAHALFGSPRGPGYAWAMFEGEELRYVGPETDSFEFCAKDIEQLKTEMARVLYALHLAADLSSGSQRRTAESKAMDIEASSPFVAYLGRIGREHTRQVLELAAHLRGEQVEFSVGGLEHVQPLDLSTLVEQAVGVSALEIPSPTFKRLYGMRVAGAVMEGDIEPEDVKAIDKELEEAYAHDDVMPAVDDLDMVE
jgi:hypothetical protein